jgi:predicted lipase
MVLENFNINLANLAWQNAQKAETSAEFFNSSVFKIGNVEGFCGEKNGVLYIAFQGTGSRQDITDDLTFKKVNIGNKIKIHTGFYKQYKETEGWIFEKILNYEKIIFAGQSLGSSLATLSAYFVKQSHPKKNISVVGFASPKLGNQKFVDSFHSLLIEVKQYKYLCDPVPMLPFSILGYRYLIKQIVFGKKKWWDHIIRINPFHHLPEKYYGFKI